MFAIFNVSINPVGILLAALIYFVFSILWHSDFSIKKFAELILKRPYLKLIINIITSLLIATGLNSIIQYSAMLSGLDQWSNVIATAFMSASTLGAATLLNDVVWGNKKFKSFILEYLHQLISFILVCATLSLFFSVYI